MPLDHNQDKTLNDNAGQSELQIEKAQKDNEKGVVKENGEVELKKGNKGKEKLESLRYKR